jgi:protocatechuate 3,4-dioxygenase beta subunit
LGANAVAEGNEFEGSTMTATFNAPHYAVATGTDMFLDFYDSKLSGTGLALPPDAYNTSDAYVPNGAEAGPVYTAGAIFPLQQTPLPITLSGNVYYDPNANNIHETGETGIAGVTLSLFELVEGNYVDTGKTALTDAAGHYKFEGILPGTYRVQETQPSGYLSVGDTVGTVNGLSRGYITTVDILSGIALEGGEDSINNDFAETLPATLSGHVYYDANNNGVRDAGETGIAGATVKLLDSEGNPTGATATTDSTGYYQFTTLMPGTYGVSEVQPDGYLDGIDAAGTLGGTAHNPGDLIDGVQLLGGQNGEDYDFGEILPCSLSGRVFLDLNGDATYDSGDTLLAGVTIKLLDGSGNLIRTTTTDDNGDYAFTSLTPGVYQVEEVQPDGYLQGDSLIGSVGGTRVSVDLMKSINIPASVDAIRYDFYEVPPASLSGYVYADDDNDGVFDDTEVGIGGVTVTLLDASGNSTGLTTVTDSDGYYSFTDLRPGTYGVAETQPSGYLDGLDAAGTHGGTAHNPGDLIDQITLAGGDNAKNYDFGEIRPASIEGTVFVDANNNETYDSGEKLLAGVTMYLTDSEGNQVATALTDANGHYIFQNLMPGTYSVEEIQPSGYLEGGNRVGSVGGTLNGPDHTIDVSLGPDVHGVNYDFWEIMPAKISGYVFQDGPTIKIKQGDPVPNIPSIRDGLLTPDDTRLSGVTLRLCDGTGYPLYDKSGNPITTVTNADGYYEFNNLEPGLYSIIQVQPTGYIQGLDTAGSLGGVVVDQYTVVPSSLLSTLAVDPEGSSIVQIQIDQGSTGVEYNFSEVKVVEVPPETPHPNPPEPPRSPLSPPQGIYGEPVFYHPPFAPINTPVSMPFAGGSGGPGGFTWHLSVLNGGQPRNLNGGSDASIYPATETFDPATWTGADLNQGGEWIIADENGTPVQNYRFGVSGSTPVVGNWNGAGTSKIGVFMGGYWFLDLNGNGRWDEDDLWAKLGDEEDQPVAGDWDGDGKSDIGIFGNAWIGDAKAIESEPGLPDPLNPPKNRYKNVPPEPHEAAVGFRTMKRTHAGNFRSDLIDHVFEFGTSGDRAVVGDWTGNGIKKIGVFRDGKWYLDIDGDGRWSAADVLVEFGREGDLPVAGDWTGDGVTKLGVYRNGTFYLDTNNDRQMDATDKVFELGAPGDKPFAGDFAGKGIDTVGVYREPPQTAHAKTPPRAASIK